MGVLATTNAKQMMVLLLTMRLRNLNWQVGRVQRQNPPQVQELANLQQAIADAVLELAVTNG